MLADELATLLDSTPLDEVVAAIDDSARQAQHGWDLRLWTYRIGPCSVCFLHYDELGRPQDMLVAVRAPKARRESLARLVADFPLPAKLVLLD